MNEKTTNLIPDATINAFKNSDENKFTTQFYIAEGAAGLLACVADKEALDEVSSRAIASAAFSIEKAVKEMNDIFNNMLDHMADVHNKQIAIDAKAVNTTKNNDVGSNKPSSSNIKEGDPKDDPEVEFNHQHLIAAGAAGALFHATLNPEGSMINKDINYAVYAIESGIREMDKCFQAQLMI